MSLKQSKNRRLAMKKADKYYSLYVRKSNSDDSGYGKCVTCGKIDHYKNMQCGHWRRRGLQPTRYDLRNTGIQCVKCNHFRSGEPERFEEHIRATYGAEVVEELRVKSLMRSRRSQTDYEYIAKEYYEKLKELEISITN